MNMQKVVYIIPGFKENSNAKIYKEIGKSFEAIGIKPIFTHINWRAKNNLMQDYLKQFIKVFNKTNVKDSEVYLFGFSAGAWIAFMASLDINPKKVFLCSFSPFFKEDMKFWSKYWISSVGKKRFNDFRNHRFNYIIKRFKSKVIFFVGTDEDPNGIMIRRSKIAHRLIKNSRLVIIPGGTHNIRQKEYLETVKRYIK